MIIVLFAGFAGLGAVLRWKATAQWGKLGTLILNLVGAVGLGLMSGLDGSLPTVVGTAGVGAMTTISGVAREVDSLSRISRFRATMYLGGTLVAGVGAAWMGVHWCLRLLRARYRLETNIGTERIGNCYRSIALLPIFHKKHERSRNRTRGSIQCVQ